MAVNEDYSAENEGAFSLELFEKQQLPNANANANDSGFRELPESSISKYLKHKLLTRVEEREISKTIRSHLASYRAHIAGIGLSSLITVEVANNYKTVNGYLNFLGSYFSNNTDEIMDLDKNSNRVEDIVRDNRVLAMNLVESRKFKGLEAKKIEENNSRLSDIILPWKSTSKTLNICFYGNNDLEDSVGLNYYNSLLNCNGSSKDLSLRLKVAGDLGMVPEKFTEVFGELNRQRKLFNNSVDVLVSCNLKWVKTVVNRECSKRFLDPSCDRDDLFSEGCIGAVQAAEHWDPDHFKKARFATYSFHKIRRCVGYALEKLGEGVRYTSELKAQHKTVSDSIENIKEEYGKNYEPTIDDISDESGLDTKTIWKVLNRNKRVVSLDAVFEDGDSSLMDSISDESQISPADLAKGPDAKDNVSRALATLSAEERKVLEHRFGLLDGICYSLGEIGKKYRLTGERIRQIEGRALRKLRHPTRLSILNDEKHLLFQGHKV